MKPEILITSAQVTAKNGVVAALIDWVPVGGGGVSYIGPDGTPEERIHPLTSVYQVRCISPDRMVPDQLLSVDTYKEACTLAEKYVVKLDQHADTVASLADDLKLS